MLIHGTLVAIYQGNGRWPMFAFGFGVMIILPQMCGYGLNSRGRRTLAIIFPVGISLFYGLRGNITGLNEVSRIPAVECLLISVLYILFLIVNDLYTRFSRTGGPQPAAAGSYGEGISHGAPANPMEAD